MNKFTAVLVLCLVAVANAGLLGAPIVSSPWVAQAPIVKSAPLILPQSQTIVKAAPLTFSAPIVKSGPLVSPLVAPGLVKGGAWGLEAGVW